MATNVSVYVPNEGEIEALKSIIQNDALVLGLYKVGVSADGSMGVATLSELTTGGGRGYAPIVLTNDLLRTLRTASKWFLSTNALGKAEAAYNDVPLVWTMTAADVADVSTAYGVFAYTWVLPFDAGAKEIKVGDTIKGGTSGALGTVTAVCVESGTWAAGTAAGYLNIKTKTGTFQDNENIYVQGEVATFVAAPTVAGDTYSIGDLFRLTSGDGKAMGVVLSLTGGDNTPVATIGTVPGYGGRDYTVGAGKVTAKLSGGGNDALTVEIASLATAAYAVTNTGLTADATKKLMAVWPFASGVAITTVGQTITWDMKLALASGA
jgi:hypothetical protein